MDIGAFQSEGTALSVNTTAGGVGSAPGQLSLPQAINLADVLSTADSISFATAAFSGPETITLTAGPLVLTDKATTTITGPAANLLSISGNKASQVFDIKGGSAALSGLTITGGSANSGGGLDDEGGTVSLTNCAITGNAAAAQGGGLYNFDGTLSLSGCTVSSNTALTGAGLAGNGGSLSLVNTTVSGNTATGQGGGLYVRLGTATLTNVTVSANSAQTGGGLVNSGNTATVTLTNTIVAGQTTGGDVTGNYTGGNNVIGVNPLLGILFDYGGPTLTMPLLPGSPAIGGGTTGTGVPTTDQRGFARSGSIDIGAFQTQGAASMVVNVTTDGPGSGLGQLDLRQAINLANVQPGTNTVTFSPSVFGTTPRTITLTEGEIGVGGPGSQVIDGPGASLLTIDGNNASRVFYMYGTGTSVALSGLTITGGNAPEGGGVADRYGTLLLSNCTVRGNSAGNIGGGVISISGTATLTNCTISGNSSANQGGGVVSNSSTLSLSNCTVSGNSATNGAGGVFNYFGGTSLTDSTVSGNSAGGNGGGLTNEGGELTLSNCTVSGNSVTLSGGGGLYNIDNALTTLTNCTVSDNSATGTRYGGGGALNRTATLSFTNTIVAGNNGGDVGGSYTGSNNVIGGNPLLSSLGNYGGPTLTMALLPGSPAIGKGASGASIPLTDQRGVTRFGHVDIGAFQSQGFSLVPAVSSTPQSAASGKAFANSLVVTVRANNPVEPVDGGVITFAAPASGASATLSSTTPTIADGQTSVIATANTTTGQYFVTASVDLAMTVGFALTNTAPPGSKLSTFTVTSTADDGSNGTLRWAIDKAIASNQSAAIVFSSLFNLPQTITLTGGSLGLTSTDTTTITGPGANLLTISGNKTSGVFDIDGGSAVLSGLTITDGNAPNGAGVLNDGGTLTLTNCTVSGDSATARGAAWPPGSVARPRSPTVLSTTTQPPLAAAWQLQRRAR